MIKNRAVSAGAASSKYYDKEGYYTPGSDEARAASEWFGRAAKDAGHVGEVDGDKFTALLEGKAPDGQVLGVVRGGERQHRPGIDLTMNAPKEVSVLALVFGDTRVVEAHDKAVREIASYVEDKLMMTRVGKSGAIEVVAAPNTIAGLFRHETSRELDPHLHTHAVFANMVKTDLGDKYRSIHNDVIAQNALMLTQLYQSRMLQQMQALGYEASLDRKGFLQVEGLEDLKAPFSKRHLQIVQSLDERGLEANGKNRQIAALMTRANKQITDRKELTPIWDKQAEMEGWTKARQEAFVQASKDRAQRLTPAKDQPPEQTSDPTKEAAQSTAKNGRAGSANTAQEQDHRFPSARTDDVREAVAFAIRHISEREAVYHEADLKTQALRRLETPDIRGIDTEIGRLIKEDQLFAVQTEKGLYFSDKETLTAERDVMRNYRASVREPGVEIDKTLRHRLTTRRTVVAALERRMDETTLTAGQRAAVKTSLTGEGRFVGVQGYAGTGKTFMLSKAQDYAARYGFEVEGIAPTNSARVELGEVISNSRTVMSFLLDHKNNPDEQRGSNRILVVDEAAMISTRDFRDIMKAANEQGIRRVVFQGDIKQLEAVGAGVPFKQLQEAGMSVALMDDIQRQQNDPAKKAVIHALRGEVRQAFAKVGRVDEVKDIAQATADTWLGLTKKDRAETGVLVLTNKRRAAVNDAIRAGLNAEKTLTGRSVELPTINPLNLTRAAAGDAASYRVGDTILAIGRLKRAKIEPYDLLKVVGRDLENNTLQLQREASKRSLTVPLGQSGKAAEKLVAFEDDKRRFQRGDYVKFNLADRDANILKGERGTITKITKKAVSVVMDDGQKTSVARDSFAARGLDYGYALTGHAYQGQTVKDIIVTMSSTERLATQKALYVEISRVSNQAMIITDNASKLVDRISKTTGESMSSLTEIVREKLTNLFGRTEQNTTALAQQFAGQDMASSTRAYEPTARQNREPEQREFDLSNQRGSGGRFDRSEDRSERLFSEDKTTPEQERKTPSEEYRHTPSQNPTEGREAAPTEGTVEAKEREAQEFFKELEERVNQITQDRSRGRGERSR